MGRKAQLEFRDAKNTPVMRLKDFHGKCFNLYFHFFSAT